MVRVLEYLLDIARTRDAQRLAIASILVNFVVHFQADADQDGCLSLEEWLKFSEPLRHMPARAFTALIDVFTKVGVLY